jgi:hypothetical protein
MRIASLGIVLPLLATPTLATAQVDVRFEAYASIAPGEPVGSVDVFYDQLSPYGVWIDEPRLGRVFLPDTPSYVPYRNGHWQYTDVGFVWISSEPFGWATSHYGRWAYTPVYSSWVWVPDTEWGPAWVDWRETDDSFGWAPLPPASVVGIYAPPISAWCYVPATRIFASDLPRYYEPRDRVVVVHRSARPIEARATIGRDRVIVGPPPARLRDHRVTVQRTRVDARVVGRLQPAEARASVERARERLPQIEQRNRQRVEANVRVREIARKHDRSDSRTRPSDQRTQPSDQRTRQSDQRTQPQPPRTQPPERAQRTPPTRAQPTPPPRAERDDRRQPPERTQPAQPAPAPRAERDHRGQPQREQPQREQPQRERPQPPERAQPPRAEQRREPPAKPEPKKDDRRERRG